jgi:hypothetical protein
MFRFSYATPRMAFHWLVSLPADRSGVTKVLSCVSQSTVAGKLTNPGSPRPLLRSLSLAIGVAITMMAFLGLATGTGTAAASVAWTVRSLAQPSRFLPTGPDRYEILVSNTGREASAEPPTVTDKLPKGLTMASAMGEGWGCSPSEESAEQWVVTCSFEEPIGAMRYTQPLFIEVSPPGAAPGVLNNEVTVTGGGATLPDRLTESTEVGTAPPAFGLTEFNIEAHTETGEASSQAGGHPWEFTTSFGIPWVQTQPGAVEEPFVPVENLRKVVVELPLGMSGNPFAAEQCTQAQLKGNHCPAHSRVGTLAIAAGFLPQAEYRYTGGPPGVSGLFDMKTERGYPAEFGFTAYEQVIYLYATVVHSSAGERLRLTTIGAPPHAEAGNFEVTVWGEPGVLNGSGSELALLTNPLNCGGSGRARIEINSWAHPERVVSQETTVYPALTGCNLLQFDPHLAMGPSVFEENAGVRVGGLGTSQADEPSAYTTDLEIKQTEAFSELAAPQLKDATVTLPQGVSVSPSAAQGLAGCQAEGPEGINIGSSNIGAAGQDLGNPEATELGAGHAGGNSSPYNDDQYHTAPGHCPPASSLGTAEVFSPVLQNRCGGKGQTVCKPGESPAPLQGHVFLASPRCGGTAQPQCTEASATNGELFGLYIEAAGQGVIVKLPGSVAADPATGQLTATFKQNPQLPFSDVKLHFKGGSRAPVANPQACGPFAVTSKLTSWGGPEATPASEPFTVDWDGKGGACPAAWPFVPGFSASVLSAVAGGFTPFTLTFSRNDREQDLSGLTVTMPQGLLAKIAGIPLCAEAQANAGTCGPESQIGNASALAGPGSSPFFVQGGRVYLTTGYKGQPFGLSVVVPAVAGPFNLGNVVVRAAIHIDPATAQVTATSDPLPQIKDGVPFRLRTVNVEVNRPSGFMFNPTNCAQQSITGTLTGAPVKAGEAAVSAGSSSPFAVTGCGALPFKPSFSASTQGTTSKVNGASLTVKIAQQAGEANIRKVNVQVPIALPARLTTLQKACLAAVFEANPAGCPEASIVGTATANTPVLSVPVTGPAYLVSHGNAAFPDLEFILQGQGVTIVLDGKTDIKNGNTYSRFETVPDAPISSFETVFPEGPHSILGANKNLCTQKLTMPTVIIGQNGAIVTQSTPISVTGCSPAKPAVKIKKTKLKGNTLLVTLTTSQKGAVSLSGNGLKTLKKTLTAGTHQLKLTLTKSGRAARKHHGKTKLKATIKTPTATATTTKTLKL